EHARVAWPVERDPIEYLTTLAYAQTDTALVRPDVAAPHGALGVDADPVARDVGPHAPVRECAIGRDVEGREPTSERFGHDQHGVVGRYDHAVREPQIGGDFAGITVRRDE